MSNPKENTNYRREVRQESYNDANGDTHLSKTSETVNDAYAQGRLAENRATEEVLGERDNENASRGLLLGILLTSLVALTAGALWFLNQGDDVVEPASQTTIIAPKPDAKPSPQPSKAPEKETTVIEKTTNVPVPVVVPQQQSPASTAPAPDINISVPNPVAPAPTKSETSTETESTTTTTTPSTTTTESTTSSDSSTSTTSGSSSTAE